MNPNAVLNEDQKKYRFRKLLMVQEKIKYNRQKVSKKDDKDGKVKISTVLELRQPLSGQSKDNLLESTICVKNCQENFVNQVNQTNPICREEMDFHPKGNALLEQPAPNTFEEDEQLDQLVEHGTPIQKQIRSSLNFKLNHKEIEEAFFNAMESQRY